MARRVSKLAVEAKADEPFGETVADALAAAVDRGLKSAKSNGVKRIEQLAAAVSRRVIEFLVTGLASVTVEYGAHHRGVQNSRYP